MITLGTLTGLTYVSTRGSKAQKAQGPPINASSPDEESLIKYVQLQILNSTCAIIGSSWYKL